MPWSWEQYQAFEESVNHTAYVKQIEDAVRARNEGRNLDCWSLCSFGWKHADLDPGGCTGIKEIVEADEDTVRVKVGGHKMLCPPDCGEDEGDGDLGEEIASGTGYPGDWDGDSWVLHFSDEIDVPCPWIDEETDEENFARMARNIIEAARKACEPFSREMALADEMMKKAGPDSETD